MSNELMMAPNNFGAITPHAGNQASMVAAAAREAQEVQAAVFMARQFPRDPGRCLQMIEGDCQRTKLAEKAIYSYPKGGTQVTGPSIRLAEAIVQRWGNVDTGWRVIEKRKDESLCLAWAWDLETNVKKRVEFIVEHNVTLKNGSVKVLTDERDIYEMVANKASRRLRNCILAMIPGDVVEAAEKKCNDTLVNRKDIEALRTHVVNELGKHKVQVAQIEKKIGRKITAMTGQQVVQMQTIINSLNDGMSDPSEWFESILEPEKIIKEQKAASKAGDSVVTPGEKKVQSAEHEKALDDFLRVASDFEMNGGFVNKTLPKPWTLETMKDCSTSQIVAATQALVNRIKQGKYD